MIRINYLKKWLIALLTIFPLSLTAASPEWQIVPKESSLSFTATQNGAPVSGQFKVFSGEIFVDPNNYKASSVHIIVDMNSLTASYADLTTTLNSSDWFNIKIFPKAEFKATNFNKTGDKTYEAKGTLTIRDKSAPVTLSFTAEETAKNQALVIGSTTLTRTTFGVGQGEWEVTDSIKDEVKVDFKVVATKKP